MSAQADSPTEFGVGGSLDWLIGGAVGGVVGSFIFGVLLWTVEPDIVAVAIPAIYGLDTGGLLGWAFHLMHGLVLGVVFGFLSTREPVLGTLTADVETGFIAAMGPGTRFVLAGVVYGLAIWVVLPGIVLSIWMSVGGRSDPGFPAVAFESLVGHLIFGLLLGALFPVFVEIAPEVEETEAPFEERSEPPRE